MHPNHRRMASLWAGLLALVVLAGSSAAQPVLTFKRVVNNWPTIEVYYTIACNGQPVLGQAGTAITIREDGVPVTLQSVGCPDPSVSCPMSVALVLDASGSMGGAGQAGAIQGAQKFVTDMTGGVDEAAIIWFNEIVTVARTMTKDKALLQSTIANLPASGGTAMWDACYECVRQVIQSGTNSCRAVVLLTDGEDNSSTYTPTQIIQLATRNRIRVFTIGLGTSTGSMGDLMNIASATGGRFYQATTGTQLPTIYGDIVPIIHQGFQECMVLYEGQCMDGLRRSVEVTASTTSPCLGMDKKTKTYTAPKDTTTLAPVRIGIDTANGDPGALVSLPVRLKDPVQGVLKYGTLKFVLSSSVATYAGLQTAGCMLEGTPISIDQKQDTVIVNVLQPVSISGKGILFQLTYRMASSSVNVRDTVQLIECVFPAGCVRPVVSHGFLTLTAQPAPVVQASGATRFCQGGNVTLTAPSGFTSYTWSNGATSPSIIVTQSGSYTVTVRDGNGRTGTSDPVVVTVLPRPQPIITPSGTIISCPGKPVTLDAGAGYATYLWSSGSTARSIQAAQSGAYSVTVTDANGCTGMSPSVQVDMRPLTVTVLAFGPTSFCEGDSVLLDAGGGYAWYRWSTGATTRLITVKQGGTITCRVADGSGCEGESLPTLVTVHPSPVPVIRVLGSSRICAGDSVRLETTLPFAHYRWSTGATTPDIWVSQAGTYRVLVTSSEGCVGSSGDLVTELAPSPKKPTVTRSGNTLLVQERADQYQWYRLGVPITGAVNQFLLLTQPGNYSVRVTNAEGCSAFSDGIPVDALVSVEALPPADFEIQLSPLPARNHLIMGTWLPQATSLRWEIRDVLGRLMHSDEGIFPAGRGSRTLSLHGLRPGLYVLTVSGASRQRVLRVLVE